MDGQKNTRKYPEGRERPQGTKHIDIPPNRFRTIRKRKLLRIVLTKKEGCGILFQGFKEFGPVSGLPAFGHFCIDANGAR